MTPIKPNSQRSAAVIGLVVSVLLVTSGTALAQSDAIVELSTPTDGDVLTGVVEIRGTLSAASFLAADLAFAYAGGEGEDWFSIAESLQPATDAQLALWDTTAISDGTYHLRLRLRGGDGTVHEALIQVQVRNYTAAPTATASATPTGQAVVQVDTPEVIAATPTVVRPLAQTPTPLPPNPVGLTRGDVLAGFARGGAVILAGFLLWAAAALRRRT